MTGNTGLSSVLVINGKTLCKRKRRNIVFVIVSREENSFETITEDMKYKDSFHRLPLKKRDFRCKNISNCCRNALTLFDCLFFFSLLLMYTECQGHEPSSKNRQSRWNFLYNLSSFFLWCNNENEARADISQSDSVSNQSSGGKVTFCARAWAKKRLWAGTPRNVKFSQEVDSFYNCSSNFKSSVCYASCRKPHIFSLRVVNTSARLETISTTNWPVMPLRFIYFFRSTSVKFRPFSYRCKLQNDRYLKTDS